MSQVPPLSGRPVIVAGLFLKCVIAAFLWGGAIAESFAVSYTNIASAATVDPAGGASIYYSFPLFPGSGFVNWSGEQFVPKAATAMTSANGFSIIDFETASGFDQASQALNSAGAVFVSTGTIAPFAASNQVGSITMANGIQVSVEWRRFENVPNILYGPDPNNGVFLVRDRTANDTVSSGQQGLIAGRIFQTPAAGGTYLTFDRNLSDFGVVLNTNAVNSVTDVIALFDADGALVGRYQMGIAPGRALFFGVNSPSGIIRSVWIGQNTATNGVVIDDLAFKAATPKAISLAATFTGTALPAGWTKTSGATLIPQSGYLTIQGSNGDSKIYQHMNLAEGYYDISSVGSGALRLLLFSSWSEPAIVSLSLSSTLSNSVWRTDHRVFHAPGGDTIVVVQAWGSSTTANVKSLQIAGARMTPYTYDLAGLQNTRPSPPIVRGMQSPQFENGATSVAQTFLDAKSWGATVMRLQMHPSTYAKNASLSFWSAWPAYLNLLESWVQAAQQANLKVVISLHESPFTEADNGTPDLWNRPDLQERYARVWRDIVTRMAPYQATIWGYDLQNEPLDSAQLPNEPRQWWPLAENIRHAIRSVDPNAWIVFEPGPGTYFSGFSSLRPFPDTHCIYSSHFYYPEAFTMQGWQGRPKPIGYPSMISGVLYDKAKLASYLAPADTFESTWHVPIFTGEFSTVRWGPEPDMEAYLSDVISLMETRGWSWSYHAFRESNMFSLEHDETYWLPPNPAPTPVSYETERAKIIKTGLQSP